MTNCNCAKNNLSIKCIKGTTLHLTFNDFSDVLDGYNARFVVRKGYDTPPVITKDIIGLSDTSFDVNLLPTDTENLDLFKNGENQATYIWGLDLINGNDVISVFPQAGEAAPLFLVYKHVAE